MTYDHEIATALIHDAQADRAAADVDPEDDLRAIESMAPENIGERDERRQTLAFRARLALTTIRQARRVAALTDGEIRDPVALEQAATGRRRPSRAARRAAARQQRKLRSDT